MPNSHNLSSNFNNSGLFRHSSTAIAHADQQLGLASCACSLLLLQQQQQRYYRCSIAELHTAACLQLRPRAY
jgi:hypothetical protein